MSNKEIIVRVKEYLNKLDSADYDNIECWQIMSAFNKAQLDFVRKQLSGYNLRRQGDEASKINIDDLEILLTTVDIDMEKKDRYYESIDTLPEDYNQFKRVKANSLMECCPKRPLKIHLEQVADVEDILVDEFRKPSIEWGETFCTLQGNKIRIYTNNEFEIQEVKLVYYRNPKRVQHIECFDLSLGETPTIEQECEFKDDIIEILLHDTASILSGNIESLNQYNIQKTNVNERM